MKTWISLKTFLDPFEATSVQNQLALHGILAQVRTDDRGRTQLHIELEKTVRAQNLIHQNL